MKKAISLFLAAVTALLCFSPAITVFGTECEHNFLREFVSANCLEKGHTKYTCRKCGHIDKVYDDEYTTPEAFYILAESVREDGTLTVTVKIFNNPGLIAARIRVGYNANTLTPREFINGEVWSSGDFTGGDIKLTSNPISILTEDYTTGNKNNEKNGVYFTMVFDIIDPEGTYGVYFTHEKGDFPSWNSDTNSVTKNTPEIIDLVGKSELGGHAYEPTLTVPPACEEDGYTVYNCTLCGDEAVLDTVEKTGHSMTLQSVINEPTFTEEGLGIYVCSNCGTEVRSPIPVLEHYMKGDLNNDGDLTPIDSNMIKRLLAGLTSTLQQKDAADFDGDGQCNSRDAYLLKLVVSGVINY